MLSEPPLAVEPHIPWKGLQCGTLGIGTYADTGAVFFGILLRNTFLTHDFRLLPEREAASFHGRSHIDASLFHTSCFIEHGCPVIGWDKERRYRVYGFAHDANRMHDIRKHDLLYVDGYEPAVQYATGCRIDQASDSVTTISDDQGRVWMVPRAFAVKYVDSWVDYDASQTCEK